MKATIEFDLPEEIEEYEVMNRAGKVELALWEFTGYLRGKWKYGHDYKNVEECIEDLRENLYDSFNTIGAEIQ